MFVALDSNNNRVYADEHDGKAECFCPCCGENLRLRKGIIRRPHFAHKANTDCKYGADKDYKSEWHIRMQEYFPKEAQERSFKDSDTGETHIADVFIESKNIVIEFQHSPIKTEEYLSRTFFHLKNGRRIVWVLDESTEKQSADRGRFRADDFLCMKYPYIDLQYRWMRQPRRFLASGPSILEYPDVYSICVWTGDEGDVVHRIVNETAGFEYVCFSFHNIIMNNQLNADEFFITDTEWLQAPQHKGIVEAAQQNSRNQYYQYNIPVNPTRKGRRRFR